MLTYVCRTVVETLLQQTEAAHLGEIGDKR